MHTYAAVSAVGHERCLSPNRKGILLSSSTVTNEGDRVVGSAGGGEGCQVVCCIYTGVLSYLGAH